MQAVYRAVKPIANKMRLLVSRGVVHVVNDALLMQGVQVELRQDELHDDVEHFQEYGFTSRAKADGKAECIYLSVGGNRAAGVVICVADRRFRPKNMAEGDVCLFTENGERVYLSKADDVVNLGAKSAAEFVALSEKVKSELDDIKAQLDVLNGHEHSVTAACTAGGIAGPTATTGGPTVSYTAGSVAATKVKAT